MDIFIRINRSLAPPEMRTAFEAYVARSLGEEIGRIDEYYDGRLGRSFWLAADGQRILGYFGLEPSDAEAIELRRMYVDFPYRRMGIARALLAHAEELAGRHGFARMVLSTSSLQLPALALYRSAGYTLDREEIANTPSLKTVGNGIRRFHLWKTLSRPSTA